jgi:sugar-specific transcriptional regulator TrmB
MLHQAQFLSDLRKYFRLNIYEVKIWTALLSRGMASAGELADISGVPRSRCYDVLESLEKKGFIIMKIGKPIRYLAVNPKAILESVKKGIKRESDELVIQYENIKDTEEFKELELLHRTGIKHIDISSISKSIVGRTSINRCIKEMLSKAKSNIIVVSTQEHTERYTKLLKGFISNFAKKGIKASFYAADSNKNIIRRLQNIEYVECSANTSFVSVDRKEMLFMISNTNLPPDFEVALWIDSPFFVNAVIILFQDSLK